MNTLNLETRIALAALGFPQNYPFHTSIVSPACPDAMTALNWIAMRYGIRWGYVWDLTVQVASEYWAEVDLPPGSVTALRGKAPEVIIGLKRVLAPIMEGAP